MNKVIIGIGEVLWDVLPEGRKMGGAPANFAYHVSQFGLDSRVVSAVGKDSAGEEILNHFKQKRVKYHVDSVPYPTGIVWVRVDQEGIPVYEIRENVAWDNIPFTSSLEALARRTSCVCFGSLAQRNLISRTSIRLFLDSMPEESYKVFDINLRQAYFSEEILLESMRRSNLVKLNEEELEILGKMLGNKEDGVEKAGQRILQQFHLKHLIVTCGSQGSYVLTPETVSFLETPRVEVADTVGAGDSFTAAFCCAVLKGRSLPEAHQLAVDVSAFVCTQQGAMPVLPDELKQRLETL